MISDMGISDERESVIGFLKHLTTDELKSLLNDDAKLDEILKDVKQGNDRETEKEMLLASNRSLAEYNLLQEPILLSHKNDIIKFSEEGEEWYNKVSDKYEKMLSLLDQHKLDAKLSILQLTSAEIDEESEKVAEKFVKGNSNVDEFLDEFISKRKHMYLNKVRTDKLSEMIRHRANIDARGNHEHWNNASINMNGMLHNVH